jgi:hypothetical protein
LRLIRPTSNRFAPIRQRQRWDGPRSKAAPSLARSLCPIEQRQTDAAGNFLAKKRVKKTFEYRAEVAETATCGAGLSNTEKVKVRKKS